MQGYWRKNVTIMSVLLAIWAFVGLGCGVLFADWLNQFKLGGFPLGFWFAQQGSIIVFIILILVYAILLNRLDNEYSGDTGKEKLTAAAESAGGAEAAGGAGETEG